MPNIGAQIASFSFHLMQCLCQERSNRNCLTSAEHRVVKATRSVRLTDMDLTNEPMRLISNELEHFCADRLFTIAKDACAINSCYADPSTPSLVLKCAHDSIAADSCTGEMISPHFMADCTSMCKYLADSAVKEKFGDKATQLYEVLAKNAVKTARKTEKAVAKAKKALAQATKKADAKASKSGAKANNADEATVKTLDKHKDKLLQAQAVAKAAATTVTEVKAKADQAMALVHSIVESWRAGFSVITTSTSSATALAKPKCLESCQLYVPPCPKRKGSQFQSMCLVSDQICSFFRDFPFVLLYPSRRSNFPKTSSECI